MDQNNIVCPVCTLYLRPGITLKHHLSSHPKQKVIEALVRLSEIDEGPTKSGNSSTQPDIVNSQVNTQIVNQTWNHPGNMVNMSPSMPPNVPPMHGNHVFFYQQSMSSTTGGPQQNVLNVNPLGQYVIPTVLNPQMMPYVYQQQQVIMSSGTCMTPPMRSLPPFELPPPQIIEEIDDSEAEAVGGEEQSQVLCITEKEHHEEEEAFPQRIIIEEDITIEKCDLEEHDTKESPEKLELNGFEDHPANMDVEVDDCFPPPDCGEAPPSPADSDWSLRVRTDLNKACQTQNSQNLSPRSLLQDDDDNLDEPEIEVEPEPEVDESKNDTGDFYIIGDGESHPYTVDLNYEQSVPIYTSNVLQSGEHLDFVDMDGMHIINDFSTNQIISQVENFEGSAPDRPGVLMTIGGMVDTSKDGFIDQREESMSRESTVNIRADERMPPRGELSGQESIGGASDSWNIIQYEGSSGMSTSYDAMVRDTWEASDSSDLDVPPLQSRIPPHVDYEPEDNESPTIVSYSGPPLNFKCSSCGDAFKSSKDRKDHEAEKHPEKIPKINRIGSEIGKKSVKKLVVKPKAHKTEVEPNFDNVFTNKLKMETVAETEDPLVLDPPKIDEIPVDMKVVCALCDFVLPNNKSLREHKMNAHNITAQNRHKCLTCNDVFPNDYKFSEHLRIHPLECKLCGKLFYRRQNIQLHMRRHLGIKPYKCDTCGKCFLTKQKLDEHRNIHTGEAPIKCNLCEETFRRHSNLVQHRNRHHLNVKKKIRDYICHCKEIFHSKKKLAWHKEIHDDKPKACTQCSEKFIHMSSLTRHMRRAHNNSFLPKGHKNADNVECPICKGVYLKSSLEVHIRNHSGQRPFACLICNKDFTTKWNLKLHKWTHASRVSKPFKCDQCKGAFIRESDYIAHMNSHKSIRPYTCNHCGAQFIRKYNCQRHVKEHENDKTFNCKVCGKTFHRSYYLKDHMRIHSGVRPFSCHICGKTSTTKSNHNKHVQIHHAREPVSTEN